MLLTYSTDGYKLT